MDENNKQMGSNGEACGFALPELSKKEVRRYSRHLILPHIGMAGQQKLKKAHVLVVGVGGLGAPVALYLAAAGVGTIGLVDFDEVELSNLQRQIIHSTRDVGRPKVASGKDRIVAINPEVKVITFRTALTSSNAADILSEFDVIVDGTDNFQTRYLVNDACVLLGKPDVYGAVYQFEGLASVFDARKGPCYRCLYPEPPDFGTVPSCGEAGVMGVLPGLVGAVQANETIKLIVGGGEALVGRLLALDAWTMHFNEYAVTKDPACPVCGEHPVISELIDYEAFCGVKKAQAHTAAEITPAELKARLDRHENICLVDIRQVHERAIAGIAGAIAMPFDQVKRRMGELDSRVDTVFFCKEGIKSRYAVEELMDAGYPGKLFSLKGGIHAWASEIDQTLPIY